MDSKFAFIPTDNHGKVGSNARQVIRRHCTRDKNKQPNSRRSKRAACRKEAPRIIDQSHECSKAAHAEVFSARALLGRPPPSDWALFRFPSEISTESQLSMHRYFLLNPIRDPLCSFKHHGIVVDFDLDHTACFCMLVADELCFHTMLFLASSSQDLISKRCLSTTSRNHLKKTLPLLNRRLSNIGAQEDTMLLYVIGVLASTAMLFGDFEAVKAHSTGISKMLQLRGAQTITKSSSSICLAIDRLNFSSALLTNVWQPFHTRTTWMEPVFPDEIIELYRASQMTSVKDVLSGELSRIFEILQCTSLVFDLHHSSGVPINGSWLQGCIGYLQHGLLETRGQLKDTMSKCLHLAMMAFLATTFRIPDIYDHPCATALADELYHALIELRESDQVVPEDLGTWLLLMSLVSKSHAPVSSVRKDWGEGLKMHSLSWGQVRRQLKRLMWTDAFHEHAGKRCFHAMRKADAQ